MKLVVGLGNPGKKYIKTRHNLGFQVLEAYAKKNTHSFKKNEKLKAELVETNYAGNKLILIKPLTFMNLSGETVSLVLKWYKESILNMLVIHDDIDLEFGKIRLRENGRAGGHNGIQSIINHVGTDIFKRLKIGVGRPPQEIDPANYVLANFNNEEIKLIPDIIEKAVMQIEEFVKKRYYHDLIINYMIRVSCFKLRIN
ncbi:MAG: aminoacyl-tRNA hydrolase [Candidatus Margulisbacteria bacterium]|nr:aminoacyl-tRNA hydrolase [Candidatus Margulisiibacteriota bacterium]